MAGPLDLADPERSRIREAKEQDVSAMTEVFFRSFNAPFWQYFISDKIGRANGEQDIVWEKGNKIVGFARWVLPQRDGNLERKWPEMDPKDWDMEIFEKFFVEENRHEMMQTTPHWMLEMLDVQEPTKGTALAQVCSNGPYYKKRHAFTGEKDIDLPERPDAYGSYHCRSLIRKPQGQKAA
ncbi:hypothetical protein EJ03DRAFT_348587 [Teratosphaeria nubilosa]|uniref:N-acetyltransferase domain-containing protein n=1 Tax=Teratosphaeria nubilosa TaxID=161662 RepID=A0A6G1LIF1_9PEZI|nr:hypothetical protein EJ03DRAFT_348587 [Teratosphaeria nubilosa]